MKHVKLFSAHTDSADDAARELEQLMSAWASQFPNIEIVSATTSIAATHDLEKEDQVVVVAIMTVIFNVTDPPLED